MESFLIGCLVGFAAGLFGIGGSLLATPLFRLSGVDPLLALATPLPGVIPTALAGVLAYHRHHLIQWKTAAWILLGGIPTTIAGALLTDWISGRSLMIATGLLLLFVGFRFFGQSLQDTPEQTLPRNALVRNFPLALIGVGLGTGLLSGLLAIGGGIVLVPALSLGFRLELKQALATSLVCVAGMAVPGTIVHAWLGHISTTLLLPFLLGSIPCAYVGAYVAIRLSSRSLRLLYGTAVSAFALYFLWTQWMGG